MRRFTLCVHVDRIDTCNEIRLVLYVKIVKAEF